MYKTLYRTYRPITFKQIIGQEIIKKSLIKAIEKDKISHSYLFSGKSGTGKTTLAKIFAKAINCLDPNKPCNTCKTCVSINDNTTIDIVEMDAASNNGVEQIRNLIDSIQYPPIVCKYKVYIIDEVHMLTSSAFNALLKTLEEPPSNSIFILATTEEHKIPETILTRCQRYNFKEVTTIEITKLLEKIMQKENKDFDPEALKTISEMSGGSVRKALSITEQCIHLESKLSVELINDVYNLVPTKDLSELLVLANNSDFEAVHNKLELVSQNSTNYHIVLEDILLFLKSVLIQDYQTNQKNKFDSVIKENGIKFESDFIFKAVEIIKNTLQKIKFSSNPKLQFEICILEITNVSSTPIKTKVLSEKLVEKKTEIKNQTKELNKPPTIIQDEKEFVIKTYNDPEMDAQKSVDIPIEQKKSILAELKAEQEEIVQNQIIETPPLEEINLQHSEILNILVSAVKPQREFFTQKLISLERIERDKNNSKWLSLLSNCKIVAASNDAVIILYEYEASSNVLNSYSRDNDFLKFVKDYFGREYLFIGTWNDEWREEVNGYRNLKEQKALPTPQKVEVPVHKPKTILDQTEIQEAKDFFGDLLEIEEFK